MSHSPPIFDVNFILLTLTLHPPSVIVGWAMKKMREYLGEEEQTLTDFILTKLHKVRTKTPILLMPSLNTI